MEILKNYAKWYINNSWSNQIAIGIIIIAIMALVTKYGFMKMSWSWLKISSPWKLFGKIVSLAAIVGICYGIYLLANYCTPSKSERLFKKIIANQIEVQTKGETANLEEMAESSGTSALSPDELKLAQKNRIDADKKRKNLEAMLEKPKEKAAPAKPKEEVWIFAWRATDELMNENSQQKPYSEYAAIDVVYSEKELSFVCFKGSKKEDKIVLTRNDQKENYMGYLFNKEKKEYTPIRLYPDNENFKGYIFANGGPKILATLKKQNHK